MTARSAFFVVPRSISRRSEDGRAASDRAKRRKTSPHSRVRAGGELHGQFEAVHFGSGFLITIVVYD